MTVDPATPADPTFLRRALRLLVATAAFVVAGFIGRLTIIDGASLSLIWPAAGIAGLWIGSGDRRTLVLDLSALAVATFTVNFLTGASIDLAIVLMLTNLLQVCTFVFLVRRWIPGLWGFGGSAPLSRLVELGRLSIAALVGCLIGAGLGALALWVILGSVAPSAFLVWWGRNTVALIVVVTLGILVGQPLVNARGPGARWNLVKEAVTPRSARRAMETGGLLGVSAGIYVLLFLTPNAAPLAFLILVCSVWAGIRFAPLAVTVHGLALGATGVAFTLAGIGPFAEIESLQYRALVSQVFVAMAVLKGLALAFSRVERDQAISELAAARKAADERAQLLDAVLETMKEGVVVVEDGGRLLVHNSASRELAGLDDAVPEHVREAAEYGLFHPNGLPLRDDEMANVRALAGETVAPFDVHVRAPSIADGRVLEISAQPLGSDDPSLPRRAMVNLRDVTLDRQHRDTLASFAGVVAHDLQNPLSIVEGWSEALTDEFGQGAVSPAVGALMVARIQDAAGHMREFIADLMSYTIARDQSLRQGPVDLTELVRTLAGLRTEGASAPVIAVGEGLEVWADTGLVRQLLDNLIGNAVKYVSPGVRPIVEVTGVEVGDWLEVRVADNGIGIPEHQRDAVFETFHRAHGKEYGGTGLGLAICRRIVDRHGGTIHVAPGVRGTGCTVVFRLPRLATAKEVETQPVAHVAS